MTNICNYCAHRDACKYMDTLKTYKKCVEYLLDEHKMDTYDHFGLDIYCNLFE